MTSTITINKFKPLSVGAQLCLSYKKGKLYTHPVITDKPIYFGTLPMSKKQIILSKLRLTERMFRLEPRMAMLINEGKYLISFCGAIYCADIHKGTIICEHKYRQGMNNPMNFCKIEGIDGFDNCIAYGEYWGNVTRDDVSIYLRKGEQWEKTFTFPKGAIQHIHGLIADKYRNCVLILTGDKDDESGIWVAKNNFKEVEPILIGSQRYRACVAFPVEEGILYATDSPLENNVIALATCDLNTWKSTVLDDMPGPCIYGTKSNNEFIFATSVEPDSTISGMRYFFTYKLGKGVKDFNSYIVTGNLSEGFTRIISFKKDVLPMGLFQFGNVQFPSGEIEDRIVMYPVSICKYDGKTVIHEHKTVHG